MRLRQVERHTHDSRRHGTTSRFVALEVKNRPRHWATLSTASGARVRQFLDVIEATVPAQLGVHLIFDNDGMHKRP